MLNFRYPVTLMLALLALAARPAQADGIVIDKIYHPYVEAQTQEIEWRLTYQDSQPGQRDNQQRHRLAYGRALSERWFGEVYLTGDKYPGQSFDAEAVEVELIHQLTEQGESWADWGLIAELEKGLGEHIWEAGGGVLVEKEIGRFSVAGNLLINYEWGDDIDDELESSLGLQLRHRWRRGFEPALEFHSGEDTRALGAVIMGDIVTGVRKQLHWELGYFVGLSASSADHSLRAGVEYEF